MSRLFIKKVISHKHRINFMEFFKFVSLKFKLKKINDVDLIVKASSYLAFIDGMVFKFCIRIIKRLRITIIYLRGFKEKIVSCSKYKVIKYVNKS